MTQTTRPVRPEVVAVAEECTRGRRYVPFSVCLECRVHADFLHIMQYRSHEPQVVALTPEERDEVARLHRQAERKELDAQRAFADRWQERRTRGGRKSP